MLVDVFISEMGSDFFSFVFLSLESVLVFIDGWGGLMIGWVWGRLFFIDGEYLDGGGYFISPDFVPESNLFL